MSNEKTVIIGSNKKPLSLSKETLQKIAAKGGFGILGVAGGVAASSLFMGMSPKDPEPHEGKTYEKPNVEAEPMEIKSVTDDMSFSEAFNTARHEAGGPIGYFTWHGKVFETIYEEEMEQLSPDEKKALYNNVMEKYSSDNELQKNETNVADKIEAPVIIIHDKAPSSTHVTDDMSFKDAFAVAREEVGPGGIFEWNGKTYNTYTKEEMNEMSNEQKQEFVASVGITTVEEHDISATDVDIVNIDGGTSTIPTTKTEDKEEENITDNSTEQLIEEQWVDDGAGNKVHIAAFLVNGQQVMKIDQDGDGVYDMTMTPNADGSVHMQTADGKEATISQEDMIQFQQQMGTTEETGYVDDGITNDFDNGNINDINNETEL